MSCMLCMSSTVEKTSGELADASCVTPSFKPKQDMSIVLVASVMPNDVLVFMLAVVPVLAPGVLQQAVGLSDQKRASRELGWLARSSPFAASSVPGSRLPGVAPPLPEVDPRASAGRHLEPFSGFLPGRLVKE